MSSSVETLNKNLTLKSPIFAAWCGLPDQSVAGYLAKIDGFGAVVTDMQHGAIDFLTTTRAISLVAAAGKPCVPRIPVGEFGTASRLLDAGASGIIAPMINNVEDARKFAAAIKYPPVGERSFGPQPAITLTGLTGAEYFKRSNDFIKSFAMVETREALGCIDEILEVEGIDAVFIGPSDLAIGLSRGTTLDVGGVEINEAIDYALDRIHAANRYASIYASTGDQAADYARRGYDLIAVGSDLSFLRAGANAALNLARL